MSSKIWEIKKPKVFLFIYFTWIGCWFGGHRWMMSFHFPASVCFFQHTVLFSCWMQICSRFELLVFVFPNLGSKTSPVNSPVWYIGPEWQPNNKMPRTPPIMVRFVNGPWPDSQLTTLELHPRPHPHQHPLHHPWHLLHGL